VDRDPGLRGIIELMRATLAALLLVLLPLPSRAEEGAAARLVVIGHPGDVAGLESTDLAPTIAIYLADLDVEVEIVVLSPSPETPADPEQPVRDVLSSHDATFAVWWSPPVPGETVLNVGALRGEEMRTCAVRLEAQPPGTLRRTVAALVRSVVEIHNAGGDVRAAGASLGQDQEAVAPPPDRTVAAQPTPEPEPPAPPPAGPIEAPVEHEDTGPPPAARPDRLSLGLSAFYGYRVTQQPGPSYHAVGLGVWIRAVEWIGVLVTGRLGLPADLDAPEGGSAWHASVAAGIGIDRQVRSVALGGLIGADLLWLWGEAHTGQGGESRSFDYFGVGALAQVFARITVWRWLELLVRVEAVWRPGDRPVFTMHGREVAGPGFYEIGFEAGVGCRF